MEKQLNMLNALRTDFIKWADSNEPSTWELDINEIGGHITGFSFDDDPTVILDCNKNEGRWFLSVGGFDNEGECHPIEELTAEQISEIRILVETWLTRKDGTSF